MIQPAWTNNHGRQYRYYTCSKRIKAGYGKCKLPTLPAGEIEGMVVEQLRSLLRQPDVIARTYREIQAASQNEPSPAAVSQLEELRQRRKQIQQAIRAVLNSGDHNDQFLAEELKRLQGELKSLEHSIRPLEEMPELCEPMELSQVTEALGRIDPLWEVLHPEEQRRVIELLIETMIISKQSLDIHFRAGGIGQIIAELQPIGAGND